MNNYRVFSDTKIVIPALIISLILFLFTVPLFINVYAFYISEKHAVYFSVKLFFFTLIRGKVYKENGIYIQHNKKITKLKIQANKFKSGVKPLLDFNIVKVKNIIKTGTKNHAFMRGITGFLVNFSGGFLSYILKNKRPYINAENSLEIYEDEDFFNAYFSIGAVFNLYIVTANLIKILIGSLINKWKKKTE